jgi:hypothetical protein
MHSRFSSGLLIQVMPGSSGSYKAEQQGLYRDRPILPDYKNSIEIGIFVLLYAIIRT